jgi:hypothetical protein
MPKLASCVYIYSYDHLSKTKLWLYKGALLISESELWLFFFAYHILNLPPSTIWSTIYFPDSMAMLQMRILLIHTKETGAYPIPETGLGDFSCCSSKPNWNGPNRSCVGFESPSNVNDWDSSLFWWFGVDYTIWDLQLCSQHFFV